MQTHPITSPESQRRASLSTDPEIDAFLAASIVMAEEAAGKYVGLPQSAHPLFDSFEDWHAFDEALERRLIFSSASPIRVAA